MFNVYAKKIIKKIDIKINLEWRVFLIDTVELIKIDKPKKDKITLPDNHKNKISK